MTGQSAIVDAFTDTPFAGNSAAICLIDRPRDPGWMQRVAREFNLPATVFVAPEGESYHLRWFSPTVELALCGHGTLASAHLLWEIGAVHYDTPLAFRTAAGTLTCRREAGWVAMDFPRRARAAGRRPAQRLDRCAGGDRRRGGAQPAGLSGGAGR